MTESSCPADLLLWPVVMGDSCPATLRDHLASCSRCQLQVKALQGDVHAVRSVKWNDTTENPHPQVAGSFPEMIGEYTVLSHLGSGGQADVYRAWHPRLKTDVVIKWFRKNAFPDAELSQLTSEAHVLCTIRHPHLGQVFDVGVDQGRHFIIMEYISGVTFSAWLRKNKPTIPRIAAVLANAARAVDAVHRHGALHLDIKPANILVDDEGNPRVIDFGMARLQGAGAHRSLLHAPGTPEYMSPEQYAGDTGRICVASDVYGLGAVLFSAFFQRPIRNTNQESLDPDWSLIRHLPWGLRRICRRALSTRPQDRFESALAFALALERYAEQQSLVRRLASVAATVVGLVSCYWGASASSSPLAQAALEIQSHHQYDSTAGLRIYETRCAAVLAERRMPCLVISTATTAPVLAAELVLQEDADWRIGHLSEDQSSLLVAHNAGPHLILACAEREWEQAPVAGLEDLLTSLQKLPLKHSIEVLVDDRVVSLLPVNSRVITDEEARHRTAATHIVQAIQSTLAQNLHCYSGLVVIPVAPQLVAVAR